MLRSTRLWQIIIVLFVGFHTSAQTPVHPAEDTYGLDPLLYNGKFYTYTFPAGTKGTPYFSGANFVKGSLTIRGLTYPDLMLSYDTYNQELIMKYISADSGTKLIIPSNAWLESFNLGNTYFELLTVSDTIKQIYQLLGNGPVRVAYAWSKKLDLDIQISIKGYVFSSLKRKTFLFRDQSLLKYNNNKEFVAQMETSKQAAVKRYLTKAKIKVKKASDQDMEEVLNFCNTPTH